VAPTKDTIMKKNQLKFLRSKNFRSKNFKIELSLIILLIVGSVTFSPILKNSFINWDDPAQLLENPLVRGFSARNLGKIFTTSVVSEYHPLVTAIFFFEYHLFGPNPYPYHLHSLILHLINGWLVFFLFYRLSDKIPVALAGSLLFLVHPFQVQAVAWISARKDLLFICFYLASFLSYYFFQSDKKKSLYLLSLLFFICALLSKALAITLPVILLLWIYSEKKRITSRELKGILPFIFLALTTGWFALRMQVVREPGSAAHLDFSFENVILMFGNCKFYLLHLILPFNLSPIYIFPKSINFWEPPFFFSFFLIFSLLIGLWLYRGNRSLVRGAVFFIITLFPVLRFIPFAGVEVVAHRFIYLSGAGLFYIGGWIFYRLMRQGPRRIRRYGIIILWTAIILSLAILSAHRCRLWKDSPTIWNEAIKKQGKSELFYHMLADYYFKRGNFQETIEFCDRSIIVNPAMAYSYLLKARAQLILGEREEAKNTFEEYILVLNKLGRWEQARREEKQLKKFMKVF